jgi:hypothetical protein
MWKRLPLNRQPASAGGLALVVLLLLLSACTPAEPLVVTLEVMAEAGEAVVITATPGAEMREDVEEPASESEAPDGENAQPAPIIQERMIIKNGSMKLLVEDIGHAVDTVTQIATDNGGYVLTSQVWSNDRVESGEITIAVEADSFEAAMRRLRESSLDVLEESSSGEDVSTEYVDLNSRLRNLEATRDRIKTFLEQAATVEEALKVNDQLSDIEAEIEQVKGRMNFLVGRSAYSTITISLETEAAVVPTATPKPTATPEPWSAAAIANSAVETQGELLRGLTAAVIWLAIVPGPYLIVIGLIALAVRAFMRRNAGSTRPVVPSSGASTPGSSPQP